MWASRAVANMAKISAIAASDDYSYLVGGKDKDDEESKDAEKQS